MPAEMWLPLLVSVVGFYCLVAAVVLAGLRNEILERESDTAWVRDWLARKLRGSEA